MRTSLRTFAAVLTTVGMLSFGSVAMAQNEGEQGPPTPPPAPNAEADNNTAEDEEQNEQQNQNENAEDQAANEQAAQDQGPPSIPDPQTGQQSNQPEASAEQQQREAERQRQDEQQREAEQQRQDQQQRDTNQQRDAEQQREEQQQRQQQEAHRSTQQQAEQQRSREDGQDRNRQSAQADQSFAGGPPPVPQQARQARSGESQLDTAADAQWRTQRHNGQWWYYSNNDNWMYHRDGQWQTYREGSYQPLVQSRGYRSGQQGSSDARMRGGYADESGQYYSGQRQHSTAYRGESGQAPQLRYDRYGRAYICENGRPVYVQVESTYQQHSQPTPAHVQGDSVQRTERRAAPPQQPSRTSDGQMFDGQQSYDSGSGDADVGRPTPVRESQRSTPPAPPQAAP